MPRSPLWKRGMDGGRREQLGLPGQLAAFLTWSRASRTATSTPLNLSTSPPRRHRSAEGGVLEVLTLEQPISTAHHQTAPAQPLTSPLQCPPSSSPSQGTPLWLSDSPSRSGSLLDSSPRPALGEQRCKEGLEELANEVRSAELGSLDSASPRRALSPKPHVQPTDAIRSSTLLASPSRSLGPSSTLAWCVAS